MGDSSFDPENPSLEDALDGLLAAANYCDQQDYRALDYIIGNLYQTLGARAINEHTTDGMEERIPANAIVTVNNNQYKGEIDIEPWTKTAVTTAFTDELDNDLGTVLEFWDEDDNLNGDLVLDIKQTRALIEALLRALDDQLRIQYNRMELMEKRESDDFVNLDDLE